MEVASNTTIVEVIAWIIVDTEAAAAEINHKSPIEFDTDHSLHLPLHNFDYFHSQTIECLLR